MKNDFSFFVLQKNVAAISLISFQTSVGLVAKVMSPKTFCLQTCSQAADKFLACRQFSDKNSTKTLTKNSNKNLQKNNRKTAYNVLYQFFEHGEKFLKLLF